MILRCVPGSLTYPYPVLLQALLMLHNALSCLAGILRLLLPDLAVRWVKSGASSSTESPN